MDTGEDDDRHPSRNSPGVQACREQTGVVHEAARIRRTHRLTLTNICASSRSAFPSTACEWAPSCTTAAMLPLSRSVTSFARPSISRKSSFSSAPSASSISSISSQISGAASTADRIAPITSLSTRVDVPDTANPPSDGDEVDPPSREFCDPCRE